MGIHRKQTINIYFDGKRRKLRGVTKYTTCDDIIKKMTRISAEAKSDTVTFGVFESVDGVERLLSRKDNVLRVLRSWGSDASKVDIAVRRFSDVRSKVTKISDKKKRLRRLRIELLDAGQDPNEAFIDTYETCRFQSSSTFNCSNSSRQYLVADNKVSRCHKQSFSELKRQNDDDVKRSIFRRLFSSILKKKTSKINEKNKTQKYILNNFINRNRKTTDSATVHNTFEACTQPETIQTFTHLDVAFMDNDDNLDMESVDASVLNECIIEDVTEDLEEVVDDSCESNAEYKYLSELKKTVPLYDCNTMTVEETFIKLDKLKQMFDSNKTRCKSEDEFMESFMRTKLYDSESDGDF